MNQAPGSAHFSFLEDTARAAGGALAEKRGKSLSVSLKPDASLVTEADLASEKVIIDRINRHFPDDLIYSEEAGLSSRERKPGSHIWVIDPLDGTTNYANGYPFYCVSIARGRFDERGRIEIIAAAILDAPRERLYFAEKGKGAFVEGKPIGVAKGRDLARCFLVTGFYYMKGDELEAEIRRFARVAQSCQSIRRDGAAALDLALVAEGVYDAFWEVGLQPWDVAAGSLLVTEAGGHVRNYQETPGAPYDIEGVGVVSGSIDAVRQIVQLF